MVKQQKFIMKKILFIALFLLSLSFVSAETMLLDSVDSGSLSTWYQYYSGLHSDIFTIPSTITPLANFESVMHVNVSGEMESYKVCFPEILLRIWLMGEGTHRMIVNQANIWNICPPEAV